MNRGLLLQLANYNVLTVVVVYVTRHLAVGEQKGVVMLVLRNYARVWIRYLTRGKSTAVLLLLLLRTV